jgi:hypothetical protein
MTSKFSDRTIDKRLLELLGQKVGADDILNFVEQLDADAQFREDFADWIKAFRDPGHRRVPNDSDPRGSS